MSTALLILFLSLYTASTDLSDLLSRANQRLNQNELELARLDFQRLANSPQADDNLVAESYCRILLTYLRQGEAASAGAFFDRVILPRLPELTNLSPERHTSLAAWIAYSEVSRGRLQAAEEWVTRAYSATDLDQETHIALAHALTCLRKFDEADAHAAQAVGLIRSALGADTWFVVPQLITRHDIARIRGDRRSQQRFASEAWDLFQRHGFPSKFAIQSQLCSAMRDTFGRKAPAECKATARQRPKALTVEAHSLRR